jgi:2-hydroxyglutarate dehydrogenase
VQKVDVVVVGGGLLGLATARELLVRRPELSLVLLEREKRLAAHQSGHNSGVVHAGLYYAPGSAKARLCREGKELLEGYCADRGIPLERIGKLVVALDREELPRLEELERRARANGVPGLEAIDEAGIRQIEPAAAGIRALWSPGTGVVDYRRVASAYADDVRASGGTVARARDRFHRPSCSRAIARCGTIRSHGRWRRRCALLLVRSSGALYSVRRLWRRTGARLLSRIV